MMCGPWCASGDVSDRIRDGPIRHQLSGPARRTSPSRLRGRAPPSPKSPASTNALRDLLLNARDRDVTCITSCWARRDSSERAPRTRSRTGYAACRPHRTRTPYISLSPPNANLNIGARPCTSTGQAAREGAGGHSVIGPSGGRSTAYAFCCLVCLRSNCT